MKRPFVLGLTGSIGMGKTTTAAMFADAGIPVWDADAVVDRMYAPGGPAGPALADIAPEAIVEGGVDRGRLRNLVTADPQLLRLIEARIHPLVARDRRSFLSDCTTRGDTLAVLDVPLLFETGSDKLCDATLVVTAPAAVQRARVMARVGMTKAAFERLLSRQLPDADKCARATHLIQTTDLESVRSAVHKLIETYGSGNNA